MEKNLEFLNAKQKLMIKGKKYYVNIPRKSLLKNNIFILNCCQSRDFSVIFS